MSDPGEGQAGPGTEQPCCAHMRVSYRTSQEEMDVPATEKYPGGRRMVTRGWWECDSGCGSKFWPVALGNHVARLEAALRASEAALAESHRDLRDADEHVKSLRAELAERMKERDEALAWADSEITATRRSEARMLRRLEDANTTSLAARAEATKAERERLAKMFEDDDSQRYGYLADHAAIAAAIRAHRQPSETTTDKGGRMRNEVRIVIRTGAIELEAVATVDAATPEAAAKLLRETLHDDYLTTVETIDVAQEG